MAMAEAAVTASAPLVQHGNNGNGTNLMQHSAAISPQHKTFLPNPFDLNDSQILDKVYLTHVSDDEICDTNIIFNLVSTLVLQVYMTISNNINLFYISIYLSSITKVLMCRYKLLLIRRLTNLMSL